MFVFSVGAVCSLIAAIFIYISFEELRRVGREADEMDATKHTVKLTATSAPQKLDLPVKNAFKELKER